MNNLEIAQRAVLKPIGQIADWANLSPDDYEQYGNYKAKLTDSAINRLTHSPVQGKLVLVTAISPTPAGEGKTTVSIGLAQGLNRIGLKAIPALREPALGPVFGVKGGACGGGYSQVIPMEDINLFFTGDMPAITAAHNLLAAMLDGCLHSSNPLEINPQKIWFPRTVDMIDRSLREIVIGLGAGNGPVRSDRFVITPASEVMASLCLAKSRSDLKQRLGDIIVGLNNQGKSVTARDLKATGAMAALLKDAFRPNLVQTVEGGAAILHGGPFGNVAHGCSSVLGTKCGLGLADFLITEGGFGSDLGGEKFLNIVSPEIGKCPDAIVLVATVRALKYHGEGNLRVGCSNLRQHIRHLVSYSVPVIVAINRFTDDTEEEIEVVCQFSKAEGVSAIECDPWQVGGPGCEALADLVAQKSAMPGAFQPMYLPDDSIRTKLEKLTKGVYGGRGVTYSASAERRIKWAEENGLGKLPVCVAKTQMSLSDDPRLLGAPSGFDLHVREINVSAGARFLVVVSGEIMLMPGMGKTPTATRIDIDDTGVITGLN